ncbi:type IV pilin [Halorubellus salinus]|uniref:type IV pilin n=1 Tax=Halorubellus salinus TaxID=755309 RepID=UPI001D08544F|nr:type IV pilin [Halorubellus salinus]
METGRAGGTNALHAALMAALVVATAFVAGVVVFDLESTVLPTESNPQASFTFTHEPSTGTLVVTHYGGDNLDVDRVRLVNQGFEPVGDFSTGETVSAGESTTIEGVDADDSVYVLWVTDDDELLVLASWNADAAAASATRTGSGNESAATVGAGAGASTASFLLRME